MLQPSFGFTFYRSASKLFLGGFMKSKFLSLLFDEGEHTCFGDMYSNAVSPVCDSNFASTEFYSINPLSGTQDHGHMIKEDYSASTPRRADINVEAFRSFLFEMDSTPLYEQIKFIENTKLPYSAVVYSGGKSCHILLTLATPLNLPPHEQDSIAQYKAIWRRIREFIDKEAAILGITRSANAMSFVDSSCQNPSRFSRMPGILRKSTGKQQELLKISERISEKVFNSFLENCPKVLPPKNTLFKTPEKQSQTVEEFKAVCPKGLWDHLTVPIWVASENMYPELYRLTLWAIDSTNVEYDCWLSILEDTVVPAMHIVGYPMHKFEKPLIDAYNYKGGLI